MISNGSMSASAAAPCDVEVDADLALGGHLGRGGGEPGGAEVLQRDEQVAVEQLERALEQLLLLERVADLDRRALGGVELAELGGGEHRRAADAVAARARAEQEHDVADARGGRADQAVLVDQPEAHRVDEAVLLVGVLEVDLAAHGGDADRVAVVADPGDRLLEQVARARRRLDLAEAQGVEDRDRPRADREDVAQDPADAGGGALERLDRARVVVRLDLERAREPAADDTAPAFSPGPSSSFPPSTGSVAQQPLGVLVGAVLRPHQPEDGELDLVGLALHVLDDEVVLVVREPELAVAGGDRHAASVAAAATAERNSLMPSSEPVSGSTACSGCGIRPTTLPAGVGDAGDVAQRAVGVLARRVAEGDLAERLDLVEHRLGRVVAAGGVLDRDREQLARRARARPRRLGARDREPTCLQRKRRLVFGSSAPGSSPASHRTWKPLQMPSTGPPARAKRSTSSITGAKRAIAPTRR